MGRLAEGFDHFHVSDDLLAMWEDTQTRVFQSLSARGITSGTALCPEGRSVVLRFLAHVHQTSTWIPQASDLPDSQERRSCWFTAAQVFDIGSSAVANSPPAEVLTRAAASWLISEKLTGCRLARSGLAKIAKQATEFSRACSGADISMEDVRQEETVLLLARGLTMPTIETWCPIFLTRLHVCTDGMLSDVVIRARRACHSLAVGVVLRSPTSATHNPRVLALGVCCIVLTALEVVPADSFTPRDGAENWSEFLALIAASVPPLSTTEVPKHAALAAFEFATGCSCATLQASALLVGLILFR